MEEQLPPELVHMIKTVNVNKENILVCFDVLYEHDGMCGGARYETAELVGVFKASSAIWEHYEQLGLFVYDGDYIEEKTAFILKTWKYSK